MKQFKIPKPEKRVIKNIRLDNEILEKIEDAIRGTNCDRSKFIKAAIEWRLNELKKNN